MEPATTPSHHLAKFVINAISAVLAILGTSLMARRYAKQLFRTLLYAAGAPVLIALGRGERVREFFIKKAELNPDVPESVADMTLGLNLLLWAFLFQLAGIILDY